MPGSLARKERRRKEREGIKSPTKPKAAYAESVDDEPEAHGGAVQATEDVHPNRRIDIPSLDPAREPSKKGYPFSQRGTPPSLAPNGKTVPFGGKIYQTEAKTRPKRGPPRAPRESEPPLGPLSETRESIYKQAMHMLDTMTPEESERLKKEVYMQMQADGYDLPDDLPEELRPDGVKGVSLPIGSITLPPWVRPNCARDGMTMKEAQNLRQVLLDKLGPGQKTRTVPMAKAVINMKTSEPPPLEAIGSVDSASQSVEIVTPEKEPLTGEQAAIEEATICEDGQLASSSEAQSLPGATRASMHDQIIPGDADRTKDISGLQTASLRVTDTAAHTDTVARVDDMQKKLRKSLENARIEIRSAQDGALVFDGIKHHSSSSDYASSSGDSGGQSNASRTRRITNDGILELKASPFKVDPAKVLAKDHRRKVSLKLPINVSKPQLGYPRSTTQHTHSASMSTDEGTLASYEAEERELEYKHRHIFIGTASLDDFLEILEVTAHFTTTRVRVIKAFGLLACAEQVQARQSSMSPDGWNFVTRTTHDEILTRTDYLSESHVKLGSITLGKFLGKIPFDFKGEVSAAKVVDAFCLASHLDAEATYGSQSKAKAFRSWAVRENVMKHTS